MGYESRVYVVAVSTFEGTRGPVVLPEVIAAVDMCMMGYDNGWRELFKTEINYNFTGFDCVGDDYITEDCYGESLKSCPLSEVVAWLEREMTQSNYRRLRTLYGLLKTFDSPAWAGETLEVVHFGY